MLKRPFDFLFSLLGLIVLSPLLLLISILILIDSRGSIFYLQQRVGKNNTDFLIFKFRTMRMGADKNGLLTVGTKDNRITRVGYFLRKYKLDELPQLINVLRGEMSFVGPRPCLPTQDELIKARELRGVFDVRPGITGLAQVQGVDMRDPDVLSAIDGVYVKTRSLLGDLYLVLATVGVVGKQFDPVDGSHVLPRMRPASLPIQRK